LLLLVCLKLMLYMLAEISEKDALCRCHISSKRFTKALTKFNILLVLQITHQHVGELILSKTTSGPYEQIPTFFFFLQMNEIKDRLLYFPMNEIKN
jgi:hypothetical protein